MRAPSVWRCRDRLLAVGERVHLMGILNVTPDSFSDGGLYLSPGPAIDHASRMAAEGADLIDVGGESTRPGAAPVPAGEELERVVPVVEAIASRLDVAVSVDTTKAEVARAALEAGAVVVNDVSAMRFDPSMAQVVASSGAGVVLMHMLGEPGTMQADPRYGDAVSEISAALGSWAEGAVQAGIAPESIAVDPGIGFGKTVEHNLAIVRSIGSFGALGYPLLAGPSRKSFIGQVLDREVQDRLDGTAAVVAYLVEHGARVIRVHDVKQMAGVVRMVEAIQRGGPSPDG